MSSQNVDLATFKANLKKTHLIALGCCLTSVGIFGGLGRWLDFTLDKKYFWTIIGLVIAFVIMNISAYLISKKVFQTEERAARGEQTS